MAAVCLTAVPGACAAEPVRIFPTAEVLPANHLKFYLHFPESMREGVFLEHCTLLDDSGKPVLEPFRETELWSGDRRRLTLWLHPGRQKDGVNLNVEFGPILQPGRRYTLRISGTWPTESGQPLGQSVEKRFRTSPRVNARLDPADWQIVAPRAGNKAPLEVRFPSPLDHALLQRCLRVTAADGIPVAGQIEVGAGERSWRFTPVEPWSASAHRILVESVLEDLAGNSLARPFEVDLQAPPPKGVPSTVALSFSPRL